jgi:hypothetical protein
MVKVEPGRAGANIRGLTLVEYAGQTDLHLDAEFGDVATRNLVCGLCADSAELSGA